MRVVIVDDEPLAREEVRYLVEQHGGCQVIGEAEDGPSAIELIESVSPDVALLDIQMPGLNGFDVVRALKVDLVPQFVFITAYDRYAVQAFEVSATDYLLKPVAADRLTQALARCRSRLESEAQSPKSEVNPAPQASTAGGELPPHIRALLDALPKPQCYARHLVGRKLQRIFLIPVEDVACLEMDSQLVFLVTEKERYWTNDTLSDLLARLDPECFLRVHRQAVVRLGAVRELAPLSNERMLLRLINGHEITASRNYLPELKARLGLK